MNKQRRALAIVRIACLIMMLSLAGGADSDYWQQWVQYRMNVILDPEEHLLMGESSITYLNNSPDTLDRIYMHLYPNAFQEGSVKHREFQRIYYSGGISKDNPSYIDVKHFEISNEEGQVLSEFKVEDTILSASLPGPLVPGESVQIKLEWDHKVRERVGRAGYKGEQYDFAQWYPKMVVYDEKGWHNVPFHAIGEFYGEFGDYDVTIDIPETYIVGATGVVVDGDPGWESVTVDTSLAFADWLATLDTSRSDTGNRRIVTFHAEDVHDFAWVASPTFVYEHGEYGEIDVHVLYNISVGGKWTKVVRERSERALEWLGTKFGPYPYPQVTVTHAMRGGGMEYPMLVMNGRESEGLILHEIGHIWFYGILANNEVDEAWLDEGFTRFQERWYLESRYPPYGIDFESSDRYNDFQKRHWKFNSISERHQWRAIQFITSRHNRPIAGKSFLSSGYPAYRQNAYTKPSLMLQCLRYVLGEEIFVQAMKTYYARWKLKHVNEKRFQDVMEEVSGQDLDWFFDAWLHQRSHTDYALGKWTSKRRVDGSYEVKATIVNKGDTLFPLDVEVVLTDGRRIRRHWPNHLWRWKDEFTFTAPGKPKKLILDPDNQTLDVNLLNNQSGIPRHIVYFNWPGIVYKPRHAYAVRWNPVIWYHEKDGIKPGVSLVRSYGNRDSLDLSVTVGTKSRKLHGDFRTQKSLWFLLPSLGFSLGGYSLEGVRGGSIDLSFDWSRYYGYPPQHHVNLGLYVTDAHSLGYTDLYEYGTVALLYGKYGMTARVGDYGGSLNFEVSSAPGGLSDWSFARMIAQLEVSGKVSGFGLATRLIGGHMPSGKEGVPLQEKFTVQAAGAGDYFSKPYLRHRSSFYTIEDLRSHFHLYGDANLRGYFLHGFEGAESVITGTVEASRGLPVPWLGVNFRAFFDGGWIWSEADKLSGDLLVDAGAGLSFEKNVMGADLKLRIDFPFWLNHTDSEGKSDIKALDFSRVVIGFDTGL